jgi:hypothetical protein
MDSLTYNGAQGAQCSTQRLAQSVGTVVCATLRRHAANAKTAVGLPSDLLDDLQELMKYVVVDFNSIITKLIRNTHKDPVVY